MDEGSTSAPVRNPYPGLRPFRTEEEHLFFGRERQVDRMIDKLAARRFLVVVGTSGSGKSSLVNCGLRPALHRGNMASAGTAWRMAQLRPGSDPIGALAAALAVPGVLYDTSTLADMANGSLPASKLVALTLRLGSLGLVDIVEQARLPLGTQLLVVADQFEELFRFRAATQGAGQTAFGPAEDAVVFVQLLLEAVAQAELPIHVVLTMRSDFLGECAQFRGLPEAINECQYLVPRLTRDEIRAAIAGPADVAGAALSPVLVTRLLNDVGDNPDQLSILQHALNRTWFYWETESKATGPLALVHYEAAGTLSHALDMHADKVFGELQDVAQQRLCERVFKTLTDTGTDARGVRRPKRLTELAEITGASIDELMPVLSAFRKPSRSFLMPPMGETLRPESVIDISHESLMRVWRRLGGWSDDEVQSSRIYRRLRETALEYDAQRASLWRDPDLRLVLDWRTRHQPCAAWAAMYGGNFASAMDFLDASRQAQLEVRREAEIERLWLTKWSYFPLLAVALLFMTLRSPVSDFLERHYPPQEVAESKRSGILASIVLAPIVSAVESLKKYLPDAVVGVPALALYFMLASWGKQRHRRIQLVRLNRLAAESAGRADEPDDPAMVAVHAVDVHVTVYAAAWQRALAQWADWSFSLCQAAALTVSLVLLPRLFGADLGGATGWGLLLCLVVSFWLYHVMFWTSKQQATPGMRMLDLFVTDLQGQPLTRRRASGRFFVRFLSYWSGGYGFWLQTVNGRRQTLHDRLSACVVLQRRPQLTAPRRLRWRQVIAWLAVLLITAFFVAVCAGLWAMRDFNIGS